MYHIDNHYREVANLNLSQYNAKKPETNNTDYREDSDVI